MTNFLKIAYICIKRETPFLFQEMGFHVSWATNHLPERRIEKPLLVLISLNPGERFNSNPGGYYFLGGYFITIHK